MTGPQADEFTVLSPQPSTFPIYVPSGDTLNVKVEFSAIRPGLALAYINVNAGAYHCAPILLTGTVRDVVAPALESITLPLHCVGATIDTTVVFTNLGTSPLQVEGMQTSDQSIAVITDEEVYPVTLAGFDATRIAAHHTKARHG